MSNAGTSYLGNRSDSGRAFDGRLDHVRLYGRVITDEEAALIYAEEDLEAPAAPMDLSATAIVTGVQLAWTAAPGDGVSYQVTRATNVAGPFVDIGSPTTLTNWTDANAAPGTAYFYQVTSVLAQLVGGTSAPASVTTWTALEAWRMQHFDTITPAGDAADNADPDFDGINNLLEYALGGDPGSAHYAPRPVGEIAGSLFQITYLRAAHDLTYQVETSTDLMEWTNHGSHPVARRRRTDRISQLSPMISKHDLTVTSVSGSVIENGIRLIRRMPRFAHQSLLFPPCKNSYCFAAHSFSSV